MPAIDSYTAILVLLEKISKKCDVIEDALNALISRVDPSNDSDMDEDATQDAEDVELLASGHATVGSSSRTASKLN